MRTSDYNHKLDELVKDGSNFTACDDKQTNIFNKKVNMVDNRYKSESQELKKKLERIFHKNMNNPPLQPIFSMSGTVTLDVAQYLNHLIGPSRILNVK